jgi:hypothetical protein
MNFQNLVKALVTQKSDAERLSVYIEDAIQSGDYEEAGSLANLLKDTCDRIATLKTMIAVHKEVNCVLHG